MESLKVTSAGPRICRYILHKNWPNIGRYEKSSAEWHETKTSEKAGQYMKPKKSCTGVVFPSRTRTPLMTVRNHTITINGLRSQSLLHYFLQSGHVTI